MPVQTSPPLPDSFPSFMSVYGGGSSTVLDNQEQSATVKPLRVPTNVTVNTLRRPLHFKDRESISSMTSGSTDSSPTTTVSTFDSPIAPDTSPSSSPESPSSMPLSYSKFMPPRRNIEAQSFSEAQANLAKMSSDLPIQKRPDSPGRRARNLKNLSLRMPPPLNSSRPSISTASIVETNSQHHLSAPPSPVHQQTRGIRRKPAGLTIRTPGFDRSFSGNIPELVPPTPHGRQSLRHAESSPSLNSIFSPSFGPKGGMQLPRPGTHHGSRRPSGASDDNLSPVPSIADEVSTSNGVLHEMQEEEDNLNSRESAQRSERGYPDGPIQIYDSGVYLYLEPTREEASQFDVVVNVAKEVANPFTNTSATNQTVMSTWRNGPLSSKRLSCSTPFTAMSDTSFKSAFEYLPNEGSSPATPENEPSCPEYIHVGWDHNSEILDDLTPLCELIDTRVSQKKKVLVHCQLGASRSASLIIAYGLYKNRNLDFNSMYEIVKERSRWVSPNMSLIYQLTDFRSRLTRSGPAKSPAEEWFSRRSSEPQTPVSARLDMMEMEAPGCLSAGSDTEPTSSNGFSQASMSSLSVPSTNRTTPTSSTSLKFPKFLSSKRSVSPQPLALRQSFLTPEPRSRPAQFDSGSKGPYSLFKRDIFTEDSPDESPALFSPRTTGFLGTTRPRPMSGILETGQPSDTLFQADIVDPRSPPQGQERLIMRNIDEFL